MGSSTEGPVFTYHQDGGKGEFFFGGGGGSTLLEESSPTKYKEGPIQNRLQMSHKWGHKYYVKQPKYFNPNTLLPLVDK